MAERGAIHHLTAPRSVRRNDILGATAALVLRGGGTVAAVLFYGSCLRTSEPGLIDLYVLVDSYRAFHKNILSAVANRLLPPTVVFRPSNNPANRGFKIAIISRRDFQRRLKPRSLDTTLWARFCQPVSVAYCRDETVRAWLCDALADAAATAVHWAARLGPERGNSRDYWCALFRATFAAELRAEREGRGELIYEYDRVRYDGILETCAQGALVANPPVIERCLPNKVVAGARREWRWRFRLGKILNLARLAKALFTFSNGLDYIVWKLERHSDQSVVLSDWQRRHPILAAPVVIPSLLRRGVIR